MFSEGLGLQSQQACYVSGIMSIGALLKYFIPACDVGSLKDEAAIW